MKNALAREGLKVTAQKTGIEESRLSRFNSGQGALTLADIEELIDFTGYTVLSLETYLQEKQTHITQIRELEEDLDRANQRWSRERNRETRQDDLFKALSKLKDLDKE